MSEVQLPRLVLPPPGDQEGDPEPLLRLLAQIARRLAQEPVQYERPPQDKAA